ncbi:MAG: CoA transferase, partial [Dehalococcoidia bacterium]
PVNDYGTGMMGAFAVALALHERNRTGLGQSVDSGLALTAGLLQSPFFLDYEGFQRQEPEGRELRGYSAWSRLYEAADGWVYWHCPDQLAWHRLTELEEFASVKSLGLVNPPDPDSRVAQELANIIAAEPRQHWIDRLSPLGISVVPNIFISDFRDDPGVRQAGLIVTREHAGRGRTDHLGNTARLSETPMSVGRPTPILGADNQEILQEAGYTEPEIESLLKNGAVVAPKD